MRYNGNLRPHTESKRQLFCFQWDSLYIISLLISVQRFRIILYYPIPNVYCFLETNSFKMIFLTFSGTVLNRAKWSYLHIVTFRPQPNGMFYKATRICNFVNAFFITGYDLRI